MQVLAHGPGSPVFFCYGGVYGNGFRSGYGPGLSRRAAIELQMRVLRVTALPTAARLIAKSGGQLIHCWPPARHYPATGRLGGDVPYRR